MRGVTAVSLITVKTDEWKSSLLPPNLYKLDPDSHLSAIEQNSASSISDARA